MLRHRVIAGHLPGSQFTGGINFSRLPAQVTRFIRAKLRHACRNDIERRVVVPVMNRPAIGTGPASDGQRELVELVAASRAGLARRQPAVHDNQSPAIPLAFVLKLPADLSPACIADRASEPGVTNHVLDCQVLDGDNIELPDQTSRELVCCVLALMSDLAMGLGHANTLTLPAFGALLPPREGALLLPEVTQSPVVFLRVLDLLAGAERGKVGQAEVHADAAVDDRQQLDLDRGAEGHIVPAVGLTLEGHHVGAFYAGQFLGELHAPELGQRNGAFGPFRQRNVLKPQRGIAVMPGPESRVAWLLPRLHTAEEVLEGGILVAQRLGQNGQRRRIQPCEPRKALQLREVFAKIDAGDRFLAALIGFCARGQRPVPEPACATEPLVEHADLCGIRVTPNLVTPMYGRHNHIIQARSGYPKGRRTSRFLDAKVGPVT